MSSAIAGPGFLLQHSAHSAGVFTTIAEVMDIKGPEQTADQVEVTNQSSPNFYKEWLTTLLDGGSVTFTCNWIPGDGTQDSATGLLSYLQGRGIQDFKIVPPSPNAAHTLVFSANVVKWGWAGPVKAQATIDVELKVTGGVTVN